MYIYRNNTDTLVIYTKTTSAKHSPSVFVVPTQLEEIRPKNSVVPHTHGKTIKECEEVRKSDIMVPHS